MLRSRSCSPAMAQNLKSVSPEHLVRCYLDTVSLQRQDEPLPRLLASLAIRFQSNTHGKFNISQYMDSDRLNLSLYRVIQIRSASSHSSAFTPKDMNSFSLDIREFAGRAAGVGYEAAEMGFIKGFFSSVELSKIA